MGVGPKMYKHTYTFKNIVTTSTTVWFFTGGAIILVGYFGIKVYLGEILRLPSIHGLWGLTAAFIFISSGLFLLRRLLNKKTADIEIDEHNITVYFNGQVKIASPVSELKTINTIHRIEQKRSSVQAEIIFTKGTINLYSELNYENKRAFDAFMELLEKEFGFTYKKAPMSLRWSKHYVEYSNPLFRGSVAK
jgi:hypothetical protein